MNNDTNKYYRWATLPLAVLAVLAFSPAVYAADEEDDARGGVYMEEVIVTAEKREASAQDTAATLSAFDDAALERENIDDLLDIQFSVPNLLFSAFNFSTPHLTIRGIGREAVGVSADDGTAIHVNGAFTIGTPLLELEFFDLERMEILRGPQGTLYGRNSTGGVVNFITKRPDLSEATGRLKLQGGNHDIRKGTVVINLPITERFGLRFAGYSYDREGYVQNLETGSILDDRDVSSARLSLRWTGELTDVNLIMDYFEEVDARLRTSKQDCVTDERALPFSIGCTPGHALGTYGALSSGSTLATVWANRIGLYGGAALRGVAGGTFAGYVDGVNNCLDNDPSDGITDGAANCDSSGAPTGLRQVSAFTDPKYLRRNRSITLEIVRDLGNLELTILGHHTRNLVDNTTDYNWNTTGPAYATHARLDADIAGNQGTIDAVNGGLDAIAAGIADAGVGFSIVTTVDPMDMVSAGAQLTTFYATLDPDDTAQAGAIGAIDGAVNGAFGALGISTLAAANGAAAGLAGVNGALTGVRDNVLDADGFVRQSFIDAWDPTLPVANTSAGNDRSYGESETNSFEARVVSDFQDSPWDFTAGAFAMRYTLDNSRYEVHAHGLAVFTALASFAPAELGADAEAMLHPSIPFDLASNSNPLARDLSYYLNNSFYTLNTWAAFSEMYYSFADDSRLTVGLRFTDEEKEINEASQSLVVISQRQTGRIVDSSEFTGRVGYDRRFAEDALFFTSLSRSYKSGGLNPPSNTGLFPDTFAPEYVDAVEFGIKSTLAGGRVQANMTYFFYEYQGLQTSKIVDRTSVNENIDAKLQGIEFEFIAYPKDSLRIDFNLAWLDTEVLNFQSVNNADPVGAGRTGWTTYKDLNGANWIAATTDINADGAINGADTIAACLDATLLAEGLQCSDPFSATNPAGATNNPMVLADADGSNVRTAGYHAVSTLLPFGFLTNTTGNTLPNSPETSAKFGIQWTATLPAGLDLVLRADYYWQSDFYGRVFNSPQTLIPEWDVTNLSVALVDQSGTWDLEAFVKNANDDSHITGLYFTDASSGNFTNVFLLEPRTYGMSWNYNF